MIRCRNSLLHEGNNMTHQNNAEWEYIACPLCDAQTEKTIFTQSLRYDNREYKFQIVQCASCDLIYINPINRHNVGKVYLNSNPLKKMRKESVGRRNVYIETVNKIEQLNIQKQNWKILDIGCATGGFLYLARSFGYYVCGIEIVQQQAR